MSPAQVRAEITLDDVSYFKALDRIDGERR